MPKKKTCITMACLFMGLYIVLLVMLYSVDVTFEGVNGSRIGLSGINIPIRDAIGTNMIFYNISKYVGALGIALVGVLAVWFLVRIIREKSLKALTRKEYELGVLYLLTCVLYVVFSKIVINYRPIIKWDEEGPESSFPSTHAMIAVVIFGSFCCIAGNYIKNEKLCKLIRILCVILAVLVIVGRMLSGVHWFTDIVGGVLVALSLVFAYLA